MTDAGPIETWTVTKPAVSGGGVVTSQHYLASEIGARVLAAGGNAVDAAVSAGLAIGTVEPWMSGLGGGGVMLVHLAKEGVTHAVDFGMIAPQALNPADYPLAGGTGSDLFAWPSVVEDRNVFGPHSIAVPGFVAGQALALERFGTLSWADALQPAITLAADGMTVDWYGTLKIATGAQTLNRYDESRRVYLPDGFPPIGEWGGAPPAIKLGNLARTLRRLAKAGPRDFYEGEIARSIAEDAAAIGSKLTLDDLAGYQARVLPATTAAYRDARVHAAPQLTAGPTLQHALSMLSQRLSPGAAPTADTYATYAQCLLDAYENRLADLGDCDETASPSCTTHLCAIDREGNMVALTQTLLSLFGSKVMLPGTGIMMNNGVMWFDPRPGRPNSMAPGKRPLSNMCPTIVERDGAPSFALGASGGRRIMPAVFQLLSFMVDYGMDLEQAFHTGRIDVSGSDLVAIDNRLAPDVAAALQRDFNAQVVQHSVYPALFACPNAVAAKAGEAGRHRGAAFVMSPWAKAAAAD